MPHPSRTAPTAFPPGRLPPPPAARCEALYDRLMELDDVDAVYTNAEGLNTQ